MAPRHEVADILNSHWQQIKENGKLNGWQLRTLDALRRCRTAALGSHVDGCTECGHLCISFNSCRNRHCPKCQGNDREHWIEARQAELLPVPYFHVVFTLPGTLNRLCMYQPKILYDLLFKTAWSVLNSFGHDHKWLGAQTGMVSILHTWGQTMSLHPHLHCIVPGGGLTTKGTWKTARSDGRYLFNVRAMSTVFRGRFIAGLKEVLPLEMTRELTNALYQHNWVIYAKKPFSGVQNVVEYLGRYTHKIAISNHRITSIADGRVTFTYKDYRHGGVKKEMELEAVEFVRRFSQHILPKGFVRIRHFGILSSTSKQQSSELIKAQLPPLPPPPPRDSCAAPQAYNPKQCPCCKKDTMATIMVFNRRGPPADWLPMANDMLACIQ